MLSDRTIRRLLYQEELKLTCSGKPLEDWQFQPASVDLRLGDVAGAHATREDPEHRTWMIRPGQFLLASTWERITMPRTIYGRVDGKSSWARRGLMIHCAGFVDPGFSGMLTLELANLGDEPLWLEKGRRIAQISFGWLDTTPDRIYGDPALRSRYQGQEGPTPARPAP